MQQVQRQVEQAVAAAQAARRQGGAGAGAERGASCASARTDPVVIRDKDGAGETVIIDDGRDPAVAARRRRRPASS